MAKIIVVIKTLLLFIWASGLSYVACAVLGVDFGDENTKVSVVAHGKGIQIMLDSQSKRMIPSLIFFDTNQRFFGNQATNMVLKRPQNAISNFKSLIGNKFDNDQLKMRKENFIFSDTLKYTESENVFSVPFGESSRRNVTAKESLGMVLKNIKAELETTQGLVAKDAVLVVPSYFTQQQRREVIDAVDLSDINLLGLIGENNAAALQYSLDFKSGEKKVLFFNMGHSKTEATLVHFFFTGKKTKQKQIVEIEYAFDDTIGGKYFDRVLTNHIVDIFIEKHNLGPEDKANIHSDIRTMTRIRSHAAKSKKVFSVNKEASVYIESVYQDKDFSRIGRRKTFETLCEGLSDKAIAVIDKIKGDFEEIVFIGGSTRVPMIKERIKLKHNKKQISKTLNPDEAPALGAGIRAANISSAFRVNKVGFQEKNEFDIELLLSDLEDHEQRESLQKKTVEHGKDFGKLFGRRGQQKSLLLFSKNDYFGKTKTVTLNCTSDLYGRLFYKTKSELPKGQNDLITEFKITEIKAFVQEHKIKVSQVSLDFLLDENGLLQLTSARILDPSLKTKKATTEQMKAEGKKEKEETEKGETVKDNEEKSEDEEIEEKSKTADVEKDHDESKENSDGEKGSNDEEKKKTKAEKAKDDKVNENNASDSKTTDKAEETKDEKEQKSEKESKRGERKTKELVGKKLKIAYIKNIAKNQKSLIDSKAILSEFDIQDKETIGSAEKHNELEELLYKIEEISDSEIFGSVTTEQEKTDISEACEKVKSWLSSIKDKEIQKTEQYEKKIEFLKNGTSEVYVRIQEKYELPKVVEYSNRVLEAVSLVVNETLTNKTWIPKNEVEKFINDTVEFVAWLNNRTNESKNLPLTANPIVYSQDILDRVELIKKRAQEFALREKLEVPVVNGTETNTSQSNKTFRRRRKKGKKNESRLFDNILKKTMDMFSKNKSNSDFKVINIGPDDLNDDVEQDDENKNIKDEL